MTADKVRWPETQRDIVPMHRKYNFRVESRGSPRFPFIEEEKPNPEGQGEIP